MIRARLVPLESIDNRCRLPHQQRPGGLPVTQVPELARVLAEGDPVIAYEFRSVDGHAGFAIVRLRRRILAEVSFGPVVVRGSDYPGCVTALKRALRLKGALLLRILPPLDAPGLEGGAARFNWATSIVDISREEDQLLKSFSPNHRQSIRKGMAAGLQVSDLRADELAAYSQGHVGMFARRGIARNETQTAQLVSGFHALSNDGSGAAFMLAVKVPGREGLAGGGIFLLSGDTCMYYHGFSERLDPPQPVLHLVLWEAMKRAKGLGCSRFDLAGISLDENDRQLKAVNDFKRWFRGEILHYPPTVVIPLYSWLRPALKLIGNRI